MTTAYKAVAGNYGSVWVHQSNGLVFTVGAEVRTDMPPGIHAVETLESARIGAWNRVYHWRLQEPPGGVRVVELAYTDPDDVFSRRPPVVRLRRCQVVAEHPLGPPLIRVPPRHPEAARLQAEAAGS